MRSFAAGVGLIPEQDWELPDLAASPFGTDPTRRLDRLHERRAGRLGAPADLVGRRRSSGCSPTSPPGALVDSPATRSTATSRTPRATTTLDGDEPADESAVTGSPVTVTGTTAPGNTVYVAATNTDANSATTTASTTGRRRRLVQRRRRR